jgi:hypothetical protein
MSVAVDELLASPTLAETAARLADKRTSRARFYAEIHPDIKGLRAPLPAFFSPKANFATLREILARR